MHYISSTSWCWKHFQDGERWWEIFTGKRVYITHGMGQSLDIYLIKVAHKTLLHNHFWLTISYNYMLLYCLISLYTMVTFMHINDQKVH